MLKYRIRPVEKISIHLMLLFIRHRWWIKTKFPLFQYISCYCLSYQSFHQAHLNHISIHLMLLFIPWHSGYLRTLDGISIHLMLLFIGRICRGSVANIYFNTSHVTVYPGTMQPRTILYSISIHLMLLFIFAATSPSNLFLIFQYISCYCLSKT